MATHFDPFPLGGKLTEHLDGSPDAGDEEGEVEHPAEGLELGEEVDGAVGQQLDHRGRQDEGAAHDLLLRFRGIESNALVEWVARGYLFSLS